MKFLIVKVDAYDLYTNNVPRGAFRGFGGPQGAFIAEHMVNKLAEALGIDPVEIAHAQPGSRRLAANLAARLTLPASPSAK